MRCTRKFSIVAFVQVEQRRRALLLDNEPTGLVGDDATNLCHHPCRAEP
jgi:hypothetical protein